MAPRTPSPGAGRMPDNDADTSVPAFRREPWFARFPVPSADGHKHDRGRTLVLSGSKHATGAARLAADAALRVGSGLVTLVADPDAADVCAAHATAVMVVAVGGRDEWVETIRERRASAVALGMGLDPDGETRATVRATLATDAPVVLDAGALTAYAGRADELVEYLVERAAPSVLTPHAGEFARLFGDRGVAEAAADSNATVLLKGRETRIATADGRVSVSAHGPLWLATAGTGDVLAGLVAGLLAQGANARDAAMAAVWLHGEAARRMGPGLIADDLSLALRPVLGEIIGARLGADPSG